MNDVSNQLAGLDAWLAEADVLKRLHTGNKGRLHPTLSTLFPAFLNRTFKREL